MPHDPLMTTTDDSPPLSGPPLLVTFVQEHIQHDLRTSVLNVLRTAGNLDAECFPPFVRVGNAAYLIPDEQENTLWEIIEEQNGHQRLPWTAELQPRPLMTGERFLRRLAELAAVNSVTSRNWDLYALASEVLTDLGGADAERLERDISADFAGWNDRTQEGTWEVLVRLLEMTGTVLLYDALGRAFAATNGVAARFDLGWRLDPFSARGPVATWWTDSVRLVHPEGIWHAFHERLQEFERFVQDGGLPQRWKIAVGVGPNADGFNVRDPRRLRVLGRDMHRSSPNSHG